MSDNEPTRTLSFGSDRIAESFELAWDGEHHPPIEDYLQDQPEPERGRIFSELLTIELDRRRAAGESPSPEEYRRRFPEYASTLSGGWSSVREGGPLPLDLQPGQTIKSFTLIRELGRGGFGVVWLARDLELDRDVVLKFLVKESSRSADRSGALHEARTAAQLDHSNIVQVYKIGRYAGYDFIVSKYVAGQNLKTWWKTTPHDFAIAARLCSTVARAIHYAHERGVIHRDLKPGNIIVDERGEPHVTDFGIARRLDAESLHTASGKIIGSLGYMSPEQASGHSHEADRRSDVYSLGALLYELLTGQRTFQGTSLDVMRQTVHDDPPPPRSLNPDIPVALETICLKALRKTPRHRYGTALEFQSDLERFLAAEAIVARRPNLFERLTEGARLNRRTIIVSGLVLVAAVAFSAGWRRPSSLPPPPPPPPAGVVVRTVRIVTGPEPGAELAVFPIDDVTGLVKAEEVVHPPATTPLDIDLPAGDYLIVAKYDEKRFHEVYRHVPKPGEGRGNYAHQDWHVAPGTDGNLIELPKIEIPAESITAGMALVSDMQVTAAGGSEKIAAFYIDPKEFTLGEYRSLANGNIPLDKRFEERSDEHALCVPFDLALRVAELAGKRLPDEFEYERVATSGGQTRFPWGDELPPESGDVSEEFAPAGTPEFDVTLPDGVHKVFGLASNVAEWTISRSSARALKTGDPSFGFSEDPFVRIVRGGDLTVVDGDARITDQARDALMRVAVARNKWAKGLGFRCVRSVAPRWTAADFSTASKR